MWCPTGGSTQIPPSLRVQLCGDMVGGTDPLEFWSHHLCLSLQPEEKQKAAQQFSKLQTAMKVLGISSDEQKACWLILAAIYHLGAAGATRGNQQLSPNNLPYQAGDLIGTPAIPGLFLPCTDLTANR